MHPRGAGEHHQFEDIYGVDDTQPTYIGSYPEAFGSSTLRGPPAGNVGVYNQSGAQQPLHSYSSPATGFIDNRPQIGGSYAGFPATAPKAGGLIGEVSTSGRSFQSSLPAIGGPDDRSTAAPQQLVARLRLGSGGSSGSGAQQQYAGQLAVVGDGGRIGGASASHYGSRALVSSQGPAIGQYSATTGMPAIGSTSSFASSQPSRSISNASGPPIGQVSVHSYQGTSRSASQGGASSHQPSVSSPFVPASAGNPIAGGASSHHTMSIQQGESGSAESAAWVPSESNSGGLSNLGSISHMGSISSLGISGMVPAFSGPPPSQPQSTQGPPPSRSSMSMPGKVKAVCSSGGRFVKMEDGGLEYQGGETRLIAIPNFCSFADLSESLERLAGSATGMSSASTEQNPSIKYQLPSEPNLYVDLVDDEDTQLMFDEWMEYMASATSKSGSAKLHLFVDWHRRSLTSSASLTKQQQQQRLDGSSESLKFAPASLEQASSAEAGEFPEQPSQQNSAETAGTPNSQPRNDYMDLADRMEIIPPKDISLIKFLGSGGYGEVYLGKWHSSEAAIKCLNPSLFYTDGQVSKAAIADLMKEADVLGSLRHPNVVWVYGIVLPRLQEHEHSDDSDGSDCDGSNGLPGKQHKHGVPGSVRPPAIVTEFMSQGSLKSALQRKADIVQGALMRVLIAMDAAKGMEYLHSKRIVHFDLKSANLLLGYRDRRAMCKVADFGLSKQKKETYVSSVSSQRGTLPWTAPEILKSPSQVTEKVDVYSFGVVLWELWTGKEPYDGLNYHALMHQITTSAAMVRPPLPGSPDWDPEIGAELAPGYRALMERCWAESPAGRPPFSDIVKALKDMATALRPIKRPRQAAQQPRPSRSGESAAVPPSTVPAPVETPAEEAGRPAASAFAPAAAHPEASPGDARGD